MIDYLKNSLCPTYTRTTKHGLRIFSKTTIYQGKHTNNSLLTIHHFRRWDESFSCGGEQFYGFLALSLLVLYAASFSCLDLEFKQSALEILMLCEFNDDHFLCLQAQPRFLWSRLQKKDITNKLLFIWTMITTYDYLYLVKMLLL